MIHEAALLLGIRVTSTGASVAADICTAGSQLDCAVLKASVCASGAEKNPSAPLDRSQRNEPDSQLKARAVLMGLMSSCPGESAQGEGTGSSSASNSDSTDLSYDSKITWPGQETNAHDKHPMRADEIISVLRDLLHEAREEDWFGSSQPLDHHK